MAPGNGEPSDDVYCCICFLISALRTDNGRMVSVVDGDVVSEEISEGDVVPAIELEFSAFEGLDDLFKRLGVLVCLFLFSGHR